MTEEFSKHFLAFTVAAPKIILSVSPLCLIVSPKSGRRILICLITNSYRRKHPAIVNNRTATTLAEGHFQLENEQGTQEEHGHMNDVDIRLPTRSLWLFVSVKS